MSQTSPPPVGTPKTKLKINIGRPSAIDGGSPASTSAAVPNTSATTPGAPLSAKTVIKIKAIKTPKTTLMGTGLDAAIPDTPIVTAKTKAGRQTKPTKKLVEASKRDFDDLDDEEEDSDQPVKKIKLRQNGSKVGKLVRLKHKGRPLDRTMGEGYDSEASDREDDPTIEQQFIIRMPPGEHCDYMRRAIEENKFDPKMPDKKLADISMRFFEESSKRAVVTVMGQAFAAVLVDLPTITETMKTWDRKSLLKSADVCQMLLVYKPVANAEEARTTPLPLVVEQGNKWPHGMTPPMHDCVHRRFAKTISRKEIEDKDAEVERLLEEDAKALRTEWRWYDPSQKSKMPTESVFEEDAEGEPDDAFEPTPTTNNNNAKDADALDDELENELQNAFDMADAEGEEEGTTPIVETPAPIAAQEEESEVSEEDEDESDDEDDDEGDESDEEVSEEQQSLRATKEIIADLRRQRALKEGERDRANLGIMRQRCENQIRSITQEIKNKLRSIGMEDEEDLDDWDKE